MKYVISLVLILLLFEIVNCKNLDFNIPPESYTLTNISQTFFKFNIGCQGPNLSIGLFTNESTTPWSEIVLDHALYRIAIQNKAMTYIINQSWIYKKQTKYWLRYTNKSILVGLDGDYDPFMTYRHENTLPQMVNMGIRRANSSGLVPGKLILYVPEEDLLQPNDCQIVDCNSYIVLNL